MIVTDELVSMLSFCEAHKYRRVVQKQNVSVKKASKMHSRNIRILKEIEPGELGSISLYDEATQIGFTVGLIKNADDSLFSATYVRTDKLYNTDMDIAKIAISCLVREGFEIKEHYFMHQTDEYCVDSWENIDTVRFAREAQAVAFWVHGLLNKKFRPYVPESRCRACRLKNDCKNFLRYNQVEVDLINTELV